MGALNLIAVSPSPALIHRGPFVPFRRSLIAARFHVILHPIQSGRAADQIEFVFVQIEEDRVANHIAIGITCHKLLRLIDFEILVAIDAKIRQHLERLRALDIQIGHVVRLIEKRAAFLPGALFISPVRELGTHHRKGVGSDLRIAQSLHRTAGACSASSKLCKFIGGFMDKMLDRTALYPTGTVRARMQAGG